MRTLQSCVKAIRFLIHLAKLIDVEITKDESVIVSYHKGSYIRFRADGNVDLYAVRNLTHITQEGAILNNCKMLDLYGTKQDIWTAHDRMHSTNLEGRDARGYSENQNEPDKQYRFDLSGGCTQHRDSESTGHPEYCPGWGSADSLLEFASGIPTL